MPDTLKNAVSPAAKGNASADPGASECAVCDVIILLALGALVVSGLAFML
jgi:hypothetical protein